MTSTPLGGGASRAPAPAARTASPTHESEPATRLAKRFAARQRAWPAAVLAILGGIAVALGARLPWLTLYAGLQPLSGTTGLNGMLLVAAGGTIATLGVVLLLRPGAVTTRAVGWSGVLLLGVAGWLLSGVQALLTRLADHPFALARLGPGLFVVLTGAALTAATLLVGGGTPVRARNRAARGQAGRDA